jgi:prepilin-type N-terminal cleavage/methylation domain-containing protein/prepilin-type processing-associated H-X9-DG protein
MKNKKAFTLVELLVVISIIAILLAVLMPSLRRAKEQANSVVCKSNLKNYGLAGVMYLQDNENAFPHPKICIDGRATFTDAYLLKHPKACRWHDEGVEPQGPFWPYLKSKGVHSCPSFTNISRTRGTKHPEHDNNLNIPINPRNTYTMNGFLGSGIVGDPIENDIQNSSPDHKKYQMIKVTDVKRPYATLFITEENIWIINVQDLGRGYKDDITLSTSALNDMFFGAGMYGGGDCVATFHKAPDSKMNKGVSNILFIDGHVDERRAFDSEDLKNGRSSVSFYLTLGIYESKKR